MSPETLREITIQYCNEIGIYPHNRETRQVLSEEGFAVLRMVTKNSWEWRVPEVIHAIAMQRALNSFDLME